MWNRATLRRKVNSLSRRLGSTWAPTLPIRAWVAPTSRCNMKCRTCFEHQLGSNHHDMKPEVYARVREEVLPGLEDVYLTGAGEPFLAPIFFEMLEDVLARNQRIWIVTNGTITKPDCLERLVGAPTKLMVSLDGTTPEVFAHIRPGGKLDKVIDFMKTVKEMADRRKHPEFELQISFVVTKSNVEQMTDCVELANRFGVRVISFSSFVTGGRTDEFALESLMGEPELVMPHWEKAFRLALKYGIHVPPIVFDCRGRSEEDQRKNQPTLYDAKGEIRQCPVPWRDTYIETDGGVRPCCVAPPIGNILEQPFRVIWNGPKYRELRRLVNTPDMPEFCKQCFLPMRI